MSHSVKRFTLLLLVFLLMVFCAPVWGVMYTSNSSSAIPDGLGAGVSGGAIRSDISVPDTGTVTNLVVSVAIDHTWVGDLLIRLEGPDGTTITLMDRPGVPLSSSDGDGSNVSDAFPLLFDDAAPTPAENAGLTCGGTDLVIGQGCTSLLAPTQPLSVFDGKAVNGTWTLIVQDLNALDTGTLVGWGIDVDFGGGSGGGQGPVVGNLENPQPNAFVSGIGLLSGWHCNANKIEFEFIGEQPFATPTIDAAYGSFRGDTQSICGDTDNGFGLTINYNRLGDGLHTVRGLADGVEFGRATFTVTTLGTDFLRGASGRYSLPNFPDAGDSALIGWQESSQNFVIQGRTLALTAQADVQDGTPKVASAISAASGPGNLENPQPNAFASGIGLLSGWHCNANKIEFEFIGEQPFGTPTIEAAYGSFRGDTQSICGDTDNGFGLTINYNRLGNGVHTVRGLADGMEFGRATFTVTTLGTDFLSGAAGLYLLLDFPSDGSDVLVGWQQAMQNFVIQRHDDGGGGGGGGGQPVDPATPVVFTGPTTQAVITPEGVKEVIESITTILPDCVEKPSSSALTRSGEKVTLPYLHPLVRALESTADKEPHWFSTLRSVNFSFPGICGGTMSFSGEHDNGDTNGLLSLLNFCLLSDGGITSTLNGGINLGSDGNPTPTGPVTSAMSASSSGVIRDALSDGSSFSAEFTALVIRYGRPGLAPTLSSPDRGTLQDLVIRDNNNGAVTKIGNASVSTGYQDPVPSPAAVSTGTVQASGSLTLFNPNDGFVNVATAPGKPVVLDRSTGEIKSGTILVTGANATSVTVEVKPGEPGVFVATMPGLNTEVDCSDLDVETTIEMLEMVVGRVQSGF